MRNRELRSEPRTYRGLWPRSLYGRLVLVPSALMVLGLLATIGVIFLHAKSRISAEVTSSVQLAHDLATTALRNVADADSQSVALGSLAQDIPQVRHVQFTLEASGDIASPAVKSKIGDTASPRAPLLASLLAPPPVEQSFPVVVHGSVIGRLIVHSNPTDEIAEIIGEVELFSIVMTGLCLLTIVGLLMTVRRSLRPLQLLTTGFDRLEHGDFRPIPEIPVTELARVGRQFNLFAMSLQRVVSDNRLLIDRLLSMQDRERKEFAAELHDEFGPALFGIRAEAACIMKTAPREAETYARARSIAELTDGIQRVNYRLLERLRPLVLEQMGLSQALQQLLASWQARCPYIAWSLDVLPDIGEQHESIELMLYRVAQEAITNAVRHAQASAISMRLVREPTGKLVLAVRDNGRGLPDSFRYGFGLLGMTERVRQVGGTLTVGNARPGVAVEVAILDRGQPVTEAAHADPVD
jgi:two-component system, NarL family, sensor histidine kinase UhpB